MTVSLIGYLACLVTLVAAMTRLLDRSPYLATAARHSLSIGQICSALAVAAWTHDTRRIANSLQLPAVLPLLVGNVLAMMAGFGLIATLAFTNEPAGLARRRTLRHAGGLLGASAASTALALLHSVPAAALGQLVPPIYVLWSYGRFTAGLTARYRQPQPLHLRLGLAVTTVSAVTRVSWAAWQIGQVLITAAHHGILTAQPKSSEIIASIAVTIGAVGTTLATWAPRVAAALERRRLRRIQSALAPLWLTLISRAPAVVVPAGHEDAEGAEHQTDYSPRRDHADVMRRRQILAIRDAYLRAGSEENLHRMVMEILDARRRVRLWMDPDITTRAEQHARAALLTLNETALLVEAAELASALDRNAAGLASGLVTARRPPEDDSDRGLASWLTAVHDLMTSSQVRSVLCQPD